MRILFTEVLDHIFYIRCFTSYGFSIEVVFVWVAVMVMVIVIFTNTNIVSMFVSELFLVPPGTSCGTS